MSGITVRNLPDSTHDNLREMAARWGKSVESLVREVLVWAAKEGVGASPLGMSEASATFLLPPSEPPGFDALWGALRGTVQVPQGVDLTAPTGEAWKADAP